MLTFVNFTIEYRYNTSLKFLRKLLNKSFKYKISLEFSPDYPVNEAHLIAHTQFNFKKK